jgi:hypothetical protein
MRPGIHLDRRMAIRNENQQDFRRSGHSYKIDYSAVAAKNRCVAGIGNID